MKNRGKRHLATLIYASTISVNETKLDGTALNNDCFEQWLLSSNAKQTNMLHNTGSIFKRIYLTKMEPFVVGVLLRATDRIAFFNYMHKIFSGSSTLENQECYFLWGFNINLIFKGTLMQFWKFPYMFVFISK